MEAGARDGAGKRKETKVDLGPKMLRPRGHPGFPTNEFQPHPVLSPFPERKPRERAFSLIFVDPSVHLRPSAETRP